MRLGLINITYDMFSFKPAESSLAVSSFQYNLMTQGFVNISFFPRPKEYVTIDNIYDKFKVFLKSNECAVYAFSCWSNSFAFVRDLAIITRNIHPNALIVAGGVHFQDNESIVECLEDGLFDIVFSGGGDAFIEFCLGYMHTKDINVIKDNTGITIAPMPASNGYNYINSRQPLLDGHSSMSYPLLPVTYEENGKHEVHVMFNDQCYNNCDYCSVYKYSLSDNACTKTLYLLFAQMDYIRGGYKGEVTISIFDSSPFQPAHKAATLERLEAILEHDRNICFKMFCDPEDINDDFVKVVEKYKIKTLLIGRDSVAEDEFLGRRVHGKLRTRVMLDSEYYDFKLFVDELKAQNLQIDIYVGYIISPFHSDKNAKKMLYEVREYLEMSNDSVVVHPSLFILNPYKSTHLYALARDLMKQSVSEYHFPNPNVWDETLASFDFMEYIRFIVSPNLGGRHNHLAFNLLRYVVEKCYGDVVDEPFDLTETEQDIYKYLISMLHDTSPKDDKALLYVLGALPQYVAPGKSSSIVLNNIVGDIIYSDSFIQFIV